MSRRESVDWPTRNYSPTAKIEVERKGDIAEDTDVVN